MHTVQRCPAAFIVRVRREAGRELTGILDVNTDFEV
jgi:hypothetical protein